MTPGVQSCGCKKTSGIVEVYGKTVLWLGLCKHFSIEFLLSVIIGHTEKNNNIKSI